MGLLERGLPKVLSKIAELPTPEDRTKAVEDLILSRGGKTPIVEGDRALLLYRGRVNSSAYVAGDFNSWDCRSDPMSKLPGTDVYFLELELPIDARVEYKFVKDGEWMLDPLNPHYVCGKFGCNSVLTMPDYVRVEEEVKPASGETRPLEFRSKVFGTTWRLTLYSPRDVQPEAILVVLDGSDYVKFGAIDLAVDRAIRSEKTRRFVCALVDPHDLGVEYAMPRSCCQTIVEELVPLVRIKSGARQDPRTTAVMGASRAGLISLLAALTYPEEIGSAAAQSGYFAGRGYEAVIGALSSLRSCPRLYLDCGRFETSVSGQGSILRATRDVAVALRSRGCEVKLVETNEGHNWTAWRRRLPELLGFLFGS